MNSPFMVARAQALARRLSVVEDNGKRVDEAFRLVFSRPPSETERRLALEFLAEDPGAGRPRRLTRWEQYAQVLLSSNELMHVR